MATSCVSCVPSWVPTVVSWAPFRQRPSTPPPPPRRLLLAQRLRQLTGDVGFRSVAREQLPPCQTCPICIDSVREQEQEMSRKEDDATWTITPCEHGFCDPCLERYVSLYGQRSRCPLCNAPIACRRGGEGEGGGEATTGGGGATMAPRGRRILTDNEGDEAWATPTLFSVLPLMLPDRLLG